MQVYHICTGARKQSCHNRILGPVRFKVDTAPSLEMHNVPLLEFQAACMSASRQGRGQCERARSRWWCIFGKFGHVYVLDECVPLGAVALCGCWAVLAAQAFLVAEVNLGVRSLQVPPLISLRRGLMVDPCNWPHTQLLTCTPNAQAALKTKHGGYPNFHEPNFVSVLISRDLF